MNSSLCVSSYVRRAQIAVFSGLLITLIVIIFGTPVTTLFGATRSSSVSSWVQEAYLKASNPTNYASFGFSIALDGNTLVVGAIGESSNARGINGDQNNTAAEWSGAVYVFTRSGAIWTQQAYIKASNTGAYDQFGYSVALDGDTLVVGARREDSGAIGVNGDQTNNNAFDSGATYVFIRSGTTWTQQAYLKASNTGSNDFFGASVAIDGNTIVVGTPRDDSNALGVNGDQFDSSATNSGAAFVFTRSGTTWSQQAYLKASNTGASDQFGTTVNIDGDTVAIGAIYEDSNATGVNGNQANNNRLDSGAVYIFERSATMWQQQAYFKSNSPDTDDLFGFSIGIEGSIVVVGAFSEDSAATGINGDPNDNTLLDSGAAYIFEKVANVWTYQHYLKASNSGQGDRFGFSITVKNQQILIGSVNQAGVGAVYSFERPATGWKQSAYLKASNPDINDNFGYSIAASGSLLAVGAEAEDSNATGSNGDPLNNSVMNSGAVYIFDLVAVPELTATPTNTPTLTNTATATQTATIIATPTEVVTATSTATTTMTVTSTVTNTSTSTSSPTSVPQMKTYLFMPLVQK